MLCLTILLVSIWSCLAPILVQTQPNPTLAAPVITNARVFIPNGAFLIEWSAAANAQDYRMNIDIALDSNFTTIVPGVQNRIVYVQRSRPLTNQQILIGRFLERGVYYVRVRASNTQGASPFSAVRAITGYTSPDAPPPVILSVAQTGATTFRFRWNRVAGATAYRLEIQGYGDSTVYASRVVTDTTSAVFLEHTVELPMIISPSRDFDAVLTVLPFHHRWKQPLFSPLSAEFWNTFESIEGIRHYQVPEQGDSSYYVFDVYSLPWREAESEQGFVESLLNTMYTNGLPIEQAWYRPTFAGGQFGFEGQFRLIVKLRQPTSAIQQYGRWSNGVFLYEPTFWLYILREPILYTFKGTRTSVERSSTSTSKIVTLSPQPASDVVTVQYHLAHASPVVISVVDMLGAERLSAAQGLQAAGEQHISLSVATLPTGAYTVFVRSAGDVVRKKLIVLR